MKGFILLISAIAFAVATCTAQDFKTTLKKTFDEFENTQDQQQKTQLSNKLGLIAKKWNNEWAAHYYYAFSQAAISYNEKDKTKADAYIDEAEKEYDDMKSILGKDNDETYVLAAMIANARLAVNPPNRWQKYGKIFSEDLQKAKEINPDNPRMYYLQGVSKFHTPKMFGGGKKNSLPYFEKAEPLFAKETADDITKPYWGKNENAYFMAQCKGDDKE
ncbi:MAG: hypothetical protein ACTHJ0_01670 [Flavipsychrobacter sp.]